MKNLTMLVATLNLDGLKSFMFIDLVISMIIITARIVWTIWFFLFYEGFCIVCQFAFQTIKSTSSTLLNLVIIYYIVKFQAKLYQFSFFQIDLKRMQIVNQIGHIQFWGMSPAANVLQHVNKTSSDEPIRILMSGCSDIRHILKTICDINCEQNESGVKKFSKIEIYFHQTNKELLCRCLLFLHIVHETTLNFDERIEVFLDLFGNAMIKQRNARYLHNLREDLLNFIHSQKNINTPLKKFVNLKLLRFQQRDQLSEIIQSWSMKVPFEMQKLRDQKLRYHYKERYDYRANLIDWDFNMLLMPCAPIVHYYHYKEWRMSGLAFQQRFSKYSEPNRTLSSYANGKKKQDRTSCLVRGYWGDIIISPYIALGVRCDYKQKDLLFKKANLKYIGHSIEITDYNMNYWFTMIEKGEEYSRIFRDYYRADQQTKKKLQEKNEAKKKKKQQLKQIKQQQQQPKQQQIKQQKIQKEPKKKQQGEQLDSDEQQLKKKVQIVNSKQLIYKNQERQILNGFKNYNLSVHLMSMNNQKLITKKYQSFFDVVVLGFIHSAYLAKGVHSLVKKEGMLLCQKATYLVPKKKEERADLNEKMKGLIEKDVQFKAVAEDTDYFIYQKQ